jgi:hypothetical protein
MTSIFKKRVYKKPPPAKGIGWFRTEETYRHAGRLKLNTYFQVLDNGLVQKLDLARGKIAHQYGFSPGIRLMPITKRAWTMAVNKLTKELQTKYNTYK